MEAKYYPLVAFVVVLLMLQSHFVYKDAEKMGMNKWIWGLLCLLNTPTNPLIYLLARKMLIRKRKKGL